VRFQGNTGTAIKNPSITHNRTENVWTFCRCSLLLPIPHDLKTTLLSFVPCAIYAYGFILVHKDVVFEAVVTCTAAKFNVRCSSRIIFSTHRYTGVADTLRRFSVRYLFVYTYAESRPLLQRL